MTDLEKKSPFLSVLGEVAQEEALMSVVFEFEVTNLNFSGVQASAVLHDGTPSGFVNDHLTFECGDFRCVLRHLPDYAERIEHLRRTHGAATTARLTLHTLDNRPMSPDAADTCADALCELLSLATKNTVYWVRRVGRDENGSETCDYFRSIGKARDFHSGWSLIPDWVAMPEGHLRAELAYFLGSVATNYVQQLRQGLQLPIAWILDAEHQSTVDMMYLAEFIAIERLRVSFLPQKGLAVIREDWQKLLNEGVSQEVIAAVERHVGKLTEQQVAALVSKLRAANNPAAATELEALCRHLGVVGFERDMGELRNRLVHTGTYGGFEMPDAISLYYKLSHLVDRCVLKILRYDGYYHHHETQWNPRLADAR